MLQLTNYGDDVMFEYKDVDGKVNEDFFENIPDNAIDVKPILRPLNSVTEEEWQECKNEICPNGTARFHSDGMHIPMSHTGDIISFQFMSQILEWCFRHKIDIYNYIRDGYAQSCSPNFYK